MLNERKLAHRKGTILHQLLQVVRVTSQLENECSSSDLLLDVLVQQLHILVDAVDARFLIQLESNSFIYVCIVEYDHTHVSVLLSSYLHSRVSCKVSR